MTPGRAGRSLGERAANSGVRPEPDPVVPSRAPVAEGRHCWVRDPPQAAGTWPGLLVEWRQNGGAWQGRVVFTVSAPHGPALVEAWLPADRLQPR
jgi:hypothetical protein